jgi:heat shock protein HslJ
MATGDLAGSRWLAVEVAGQPALEEFRPSAAFEGDGRVYGSTGINRFNATYSLVGDELVFGQAVTTLMAGPPEAMAQEHIWLQVLSSVCRVRRDGELLVIDGASSALVLAPDDGSESTEL